jgi:hypothetical protein
VEFGRVLASKLPPNEAVPSLDLLPSQDLDRASVRLFRGPVGLQSVFTLGEGDILQLEGRLVAVAGTYSGPIAHTLIVTVYPDEGTAQRVFLHVQRNLDRYLKPVSSSTNRLVFQDYEKRFGIISLEDNRIVIKIHLVSAPPP